MFPQFKKLNNESGIVLFLVLMMAIVIMIFSVGILTQSSNEIQYAQNQMTQIACHQAGIGLIYNSTASEMAGVNPTAGLSATIPSSAIQGQVTISPPGPCQGLGCDTSSYTVTCQ